MREESINHWYLKEDLKSHGLLVSLQTRVQLASSVLISKCHLSYRESISGFKERESFCKKIIIFLHVTLFLLTVLEKQDYGGCVFNTKSRFADITVICTVYI